MSTPKKGRQNRKINADQNQKNETNIKNNAATKQQQKQYAAQSNQAANQGTNPQLRNPQTSRAKAQQLASLAT